VSDTAYHSFIGEVEALNTTTIRRLTPSRRHQLLAIAHQIKAKVLLINDAEDHANPPELGTVERAMKRVKYGLYVLIPAGPNTHGHFSHFYAELWKPYLIEFMKTLHPPLAAAAG
jgi:homoserine O-acetyltransferase